MIQWLRRRRKKVAITAAAMGVLVFLWVLFPPVLHSRILAIRRMQSAENAYMRIFLEQTKAHPLLEPGMRASTEELDAYEMKQRRLPLGDMPLRFDANRYFEYFDRLKMDEGWVLDYVYCATRQHAFPLLYARLATSVSLPDVAAFDDAFGTSTDITNVVNAYLGRIRTDGSRQSFIQLAALRLVADQFYLYWHANYNDTRMLTRLPAWVDYSKEEVVVSMLTFSKWRGVSRYKITLKRSFPHKMMAEQYETVIPYNCGYVY